MLRPLHARRRRHRPGPGRPRAAHTRSVRAGPARHPLLTRHVAGRGTARRSPAREQRSRHPLGFAAYELPGELSGSALLGHPAALQPYARAIVARARTKDSGEKLMLAGATRAVNPQLLGGRRLAQSALQPEVVEFIDSVMHDEEEDTRLEQVRMSPKSAYAGKPASALTSATGAAVLAIRPRGASEFASNPTPDTVLPADSLLIVFGRAEQTAQVRSAVG